MTGARPRRQSPRLQKGIRCKGARERPDRRRARRAFARSSGIWGSAFGIRSSVARRAVGELLDLIFRDQPSAEVELICRRHVIPPEDLIARAHVLLGVAM